MASLRKDHNMATEGAHAAHIVIEVDRGLLDAAVLGLEGHARGEAAALDDALNRAWTDAQRWREGERATLADAERQALGRLLAGDAALLDVLAAAPTVVRAAALADLEQEAQLWERLRALGAPPSVARHRRNGITRALAWLDPAASPIEESLPSIGTALDREGRERPNVHSFIDQWLRLVARPDRTRIGAACPATPETVESGRLARREPSASDGWPGLEHTMYGLDPDDELWYPPSITLPRRLDGGRTAVAGLCGGPVTYAHAGDAPSPELEPLLAASLASLSSTQGLVSFVAAENESDWPWGEHHLGLTR